MSSTRSRTEFYSTGYTKVMVGLGQTDDGITDHVEIIDLVNIYTLVTSNGVHF